MAEPKVNRSVRADYSGMGIGFMNTTHPENWNQNLGPVKERLYNNLWPFNYQDRGKRVWEAVVKNEKNPLRKELDEEVSKDPTLYPLTSRMDAFNFYMGKPQENNTFSDSKYKPSNSKDPNAKYYSLNDPTLKERIVQSYPGKPAESVMGNYKVSKGKDEKGEYISYYDKWDLAPVDFGKPFEIYDRIYLNEMNKKQERGLGGIIQGISPFLNLIPGVGPLVSGAASIAGGLISKGEETKLQEEQLALQKRNAAYASARAGQAGITNPYQATFPYGGSVPGTAVELEKQEVFQTPDGQMGQVDGPSHEQGGIDMSLPVDSFVWSDRLKTKSGRTFADEAAYLGKLKAKYEKILNG